MSKYTVKHIYTGSSTYEFEAPAGLTKDEACTWMWEHDIKPVDTRKEGGFYEVDEDESA